MIFNPQYRFGFNDPTITVISPSDGSVTRRNPNFESIKGYSVNDRDQVQSSKSPAMTVNQAEPSQNLVGN
jgi:hypothetical protein